MSEILYAVFHNDGQDSQPFVGIAKTPDTALQLAKDYDQDQDHLEAQYAEHLRSTDIEGHAHWRAASEHYGRRAFFVVTTKDGLPLKDDWQRREYFDSAGYVKPRPTDE